MSINLDLDLRTRWQPSATQVAQAVDILGAYPGLDMSVIVPIALHYKDHGIWNDGVEVMPVEGVYLLATMEEENTAALPWREARNLAEKIAKSHSIEGTGSYAIIDAFGYWSVFETF